MSNSGAPRQKTIGKRPSLKQPGAGSAAYQPEPEEDTKGLKAQEIARSIGRLRRNLRRLLKWNPTDIIGMEVKLRKVVDLKRELASMEAVMYMEELDDVLLMGDEGGSNERERNGA